MAQQKPWAPPDAAKVKALWGEVVDDMLDVRRNFSLNTAYFHGDQWVGWNDSESAVAILEFEDTNDSKYRATVNKFKPRVISLMARMLRTPLGFEPRPGGVDAGALRIARIERQVLESKHHRDDWELTRRDNLQNTILAGVAAICVEPTWEFETESTQDMQTGEWIYLPERPGVKLSALAAAEFGLEPGTRSARDARWWLKCTTLTPRQVKNRYKLEEEPPPDADAGMTPMQRALVSNRKNYQGRNRSCLVYVYYERPTDKTPGCVVHVVGGKVVEQSPWPFDFEDRLNIRPFVQTPMGGTWKGDTIANDARQLQKNYNRAYTSINAHIGKADNARMLIPHGSLIEGEDELTGEVGERINYDPQSGGEPHWMQAPQVPRWLREYILAIEAEMDDLFSTHAVSRGQAPGDRNSGLALSILAEKDETPLGLMAADQQRGWQEIAEMVLRTERHLLATASASGVDIEVTDVLPQAHEDAPVEVKYRAEDLSENPTVHVPLDAVMPRSQAAVQDMMLRLSQSFPQMFQSMNSAQLSAILQVPDPTAFTQVADPQLAEAEWENGRMVVGSDDSEVKVQEFQDHDKHLQRHNALRASSAYRDADPQTKEFIDLHCDAHTKVAADQMQQQAMQQAQMQQLSLPLGQGAPGMAQNAPANPNDQQQGVPVQ